MAFVITGPRVSPTSHYPSMVDYDNQTAIMWVLMSNNDLNQANDKAGGKVC